MTSLPSSVVANVGQTGGAPGANVTTYLTQLAQSLNGFTGPVSNAINFLLNQASLPAAAAVYGAISGISLTLNTWISWGLGHAGVSFTPARTGTIFAVASGNWNPNMSAAASTAATTQIYIGSGTAPTGGASGIPANAAQVGFGSAIGVSQPSYGPGQNLWLMVYGFGFVTGLSKSTTYWVDCFTEGTGSTTGVLEYGQMIVLEI